MGNCKYCGKPAGFLRSKHAECEQYYLKHQREIAEGREQIVAKASRAIKDAESLEDLDKSIIELETTYSIPSSERGSLLISAWEASVDQFLEDGVLDESEESRLIKFKNRFALSQDDLDKKGAHTRTAKAAVLRELLTGVIPQCMTIKGDMPINFTKDEQLVWAFPNSDYLEDKTRKQYEGGSSGVSVRVMKGVYYRVGAFKGHTVERTERTHIDTGLVIVSSKHVYFAGPSKSLRVPYSKIISFLPFSDGFGILRDASTAKPQIFVTGDGWFSYNLVANLARQ